LDDAVLRRLVRTLLSSEFFLSTNC
jgi:hypothetical protein